MFSRIVENLAVIQIPSHNVNHIILDLLLSMKLISSRFDLTTAHTRALSFDFITFLVSNKIKHL